MLRLLATSVTTEPSMTPPGDRARCNKEAAAARGQRRAHINAQQAACSAAWFAWVREAFAGGAGQAHAYLR